VAGRVGLALAEIGMLKTVYSASWPAAGAGRPYRPTLRRARPPRRGNGGGGIGYLLIG